MSIRRLIQVVLLGLCLLPSPQPLGAGTALEVAWIEFDDALRLAKLHRKPVLVYIHTDWCAWCKLLEQKALNDGPTVRYINRNFFAVKLNAETSDTIRYQGRSFTKAFGNQVHSLASIFLKGDYSFPSLFVLNPEGRLLTPMRGYLSPQELQDRLRYFAELDYHLMDWSAFEQKQRQKRLQQAPKPTSTLPQADSLNPPAADSAALEFPPGDSLRRAR